MGGMTVNNTDESSRAEERERRRLLAFNRDVRISDLISAAAIIVSAIGVMSTVSRSNQLAQKELDTQRRTTMGRAVARLDRWQALQSSLETDLQPVIIQAAETLRETNNPEVARDRFWREAISAHAAMERRVVSEQLDVGYEDVLVHLPDARSRYLSTFEQLRALSSRTMRNITNRAQEAILSIPRESYSATATLGNQLRTIVQEEVERAAVEAERVTHQTRTHFCSVIGDTAAERHACAQKPGS